MNELLEKYKSKLDLLLNTETQWKTNHPSRFTYIDLEWQHLSYIKRRDNGLEFRIFEEKIPIASFSLLEMPGCCGICISTKSYVEYNYRGKGVNLLLNNFRIEVARNLGYGILLCTDVKSNTAQLNTLNKNNWKHIHEFLNPRTGNLLNISIKEL
jgi:hypothetical protein